MQSKTLLGGRRDGVGCRISCFFAAKVVAKERGMKLAFNWPLTKALRTHDVDGDIRDIFPDTHSVVRVGEEESLEQINDIDTIRFARWHFPEKIDEMRKACREMKLSNKLGDATLRLRRVDYAVHARLGDILDQPLFFGSTKLFPRSGYLQVFRRIADISSSARVFLATNDSSLSLEGKSVLPNLISETDLLEDLGLNGAKGIEKLWIVASQLSNSKTLICPNASGLSTLAKIIYLFEHSELSPGEFTYTEAFLRELNDIYGKHALSLLSNPINDRDSITRKIWRNIRPQ